MAKKNTRRHDETAISRLSENNIMQVQLTFWRHVDSSKTNIYSKIHGIKVNRIIEYNMYNKCLGKSNS